MSAVRLANPVGSHHAVRRDEMQMTLLPNWDLNWRDCSDSALATWRISDGTSSQSSALTLKLVTRWLFTFRLYRSTRDGIWIAFDEFALFCRHAESNEKSLWAIILSQLFKESPWLPAVCEDWKHHFQFQSPTFLIVKSCFLNMAFLRIIQNCGGFESVVLYLLGLF